MLNFTTFFDFNYLPKGIVLYDSLLKRIECPFKLYLLCLDEETFNFFSLNKVDFKFIELISLKDFEFSNPELLSAKMNRSIVEYYFTLSPILPLYLLENYEIDHICSMDADLYFYSSPEYLFDSLKQHSIIITPHKFSKQLINLEKYGLYNVSFQIFKNNKIGISCLNKWKRECLDWCYDKYDDLNHRFADQKYLDNWHNDYNNSILTLLGSDCGLAVWNINNYNLFMKNNDLFSDGKKVIFYHFHNFKSISKNIVLDGFYEYKVNRNRVLDKIYLDYWSDLRKVIVKYNLNIDKSIRHTKISLVSRILSDCTFYFFNSKKIIHFNLKYLPKLARKIFIKIYG